MREIHLVNYCEDTWPGHQLEASKKQHEVLCKEGQENYPSHHSSWCGRLHFYLTHLNHLESSALIHKKPLRLPSSYMLILCSMHTD